MSVWVFLYVWIQFGKLILIIYILYITNCVLFENDYNIVQNQIQNQYSSHNSCVFVMVALFWVYFVIQPTFTVQPSIYIQNTLTCLCVWVYASITLLHQSITHVQCSHILVPFRWINSYFEWIQRIVYIGYLCQCHFLYAHTQKNLFFRNIKIQAKTYLSFIIHSFRWLLFFCLCFDFQFSKTHQNLILMDNIKH